MKRRHVLQSLLAIPSAAALPAPAAAQQAPAPPPETPTTPVSAPDAGGDAVPRFFSPARFATLRHAAEVIMPGARDAGTPEFLDLLLSQSPPDRASLYQDGLDGLETAARLRYSKAFAELSGEQAKPILASLAQPWTYHPPEDPLAHFLREFKEDAISATINSREYIAAQSQGRRGGAGIGQYWLSNE